MLCCVVKSTCDVRISAPVAIAHACLLRDSSAGPKAQPLRSFGSKQETRSQQTPDVCSAGALTR